MIMKLRLLIPWCWSSIQFYTQSHSFISWRQPPWVVWVIYVVPPEQDEQMCETYVCCISNQSRTHMRQHKRCICLYSGNLMCWPATLVRQWTRNMVTCAIRGIGMIRCMSMDWQENGKIYMSMDLFVILETYEEYKWQNELFMEKWLHHSWYCRM